MAFLAQTTKGHRIGMILKGSLFFAFYLNEALSIALRDSQPGFPSPISFDSIEHPTSCERKLVVNSHVNYAKVLDVFISGLKESNFREWERVVVVVGGSAHDSEPYIGQDGMVFVETSMNSYDLTSFAMLFKHRNHPLLKADTYFYTHDSSRPGSCFPEVFQHMCALPGEVVTAGKRFFQNICVFGKKVIETYGHNFDTALGKHDGLTIEASFPVKGVLPIGWFGRPWSSIPKSTHLEKDVDIYGTGVKRRTQWFSDFDLYKYILYEKQGDIKGNATVSLLATASTPNMQQAIWAPNCTRTPGDRPADTQ
jgi:hypothetical protein